MLKIAYLPLVESITNHIAYIGGADVGIEYIPRACLKDTRPIIPQTMAIWGVSPNPPLRVLSTRP